MKKVFAIAVIACLVLAGSVEARKARRVALTYVTSWSRTMPDPNAVTHICYAFGGVNETFNGVDISNPERLRAIVALKGQNPELKVLLSVGGWGSGRFSEMAADPSLRKAFAARCASIIADYNLDGVDIDWEYPGSSAANISSSPEDKDNFSQLMHDLRAAIGPKALLTLATAAGAGFYDFPAFVDDVDFVNIMSYDMGGAPGHHAALYNSERFQGLCCDKALQAHLEGGVPAGKLVLGLPFYGRGTQEIGNFTNYKDIPRHTQFTRNWDKDACVPYLTNDKGEVVLGYDDARSIKIKCKYARKKGLLGVMYWDYDGDDAQGTLRTTVMKAMK